ncbi:MAG: hypothetical protein GVY19_01745 [Bacteroidetes bacterium]|nr:hypothetical protein [Bacteroidota bacterium]
MRCISKLFILSLLLTSCIDQDVFETAGVAESDLQPGYSLPIGHFTYDMNEYLDSLSELVHLLPHYDTLLYLDEPIPELHVTYHFVDSIDLRIAEMATENRYIESIQFLVGLKNYYPTQITYQAYFTWQNLIIIDSLFTEGPRVLEAADVSRETIIPATPSTFAIDISRQVIENIENVTDLLIRGSIQLDTRDTTTLRITPEYRIETDLSTRIGLTYNTKEINP